MPFRAHIGNMVMTVKRLYSNIDMSLSWVQSLDVVNVHVHYVTRENEISTQH